MPTLFLKSKSRY